MTWIACEERLPDSGFMCLFAYQYNYASGPKWKRDVGFYMHGKWYSRQVMDYYLDEKIKYWMYVEDLPVPPEEKK